VKRVNVFLNSASSSRLGKAVVAGSIVAQLVALLTVLPRGTAGAVAPSEQGWWTSTNGGSSAPVTVPGSAAAPDVPSNGLLVEGGLNASSPIAYAALDYEVPVGTTAKSLSLSVATDSVSTPDATLELCPLTSSLEPEEGGPMADAPAYSCTTNVTAQASSNGEVFTFEVGTLMSQGTLSIAILPTNQTDRVVLGQPGDGSLTVQSGNGTAIGSSVEGPLLNRVPPGPATPDPSAGSPPRDPHCSAPTGAAWEASKRSGVKPLCHSSRLAVRLRRLDRRLRRARTQSQRERACQPSHP